jgi:hypothetical protein
MMVAVSFRYGKIEPPLLIGAFSQDDSGFHRHDSD